MTRHFKMLPWDYTGGKASSEPIKQDMKLNLRGMGRKCGVESGAGRDGRRSDFKEKRVLGRHERSACSSLQYSPASQKEIFDGLILRIIFVLVVCCLQGN